MAYNKQGQWIEETSDIVSTTEQTLPTDINTFEQTMPTLGQEYLQQKQVYDTNLAGIQGTNVETTANALMTKETGIPYNNIKNILTQISGGKLSLTPMLNAVAQKLNISNMLNAWQRYINLRNEHPNQEDEVPDTENIIGLYPDGTKIYGRIKVKDLLNKWGKYIKQVASNGLTRLNSLYQPYLQKAQSNVNAQANAYTTGTQAQTMNTAQTQAEQGKFQREDILQNIQNQRKQESLYQGNDYMAGLR